jgi:hypothetical protein
MPSIRSSWAGRQIDESDEQPENAESSIERRSESVSNATVARDRHPMKQRCEMGSTEDGMEIDESEKQSRNTERASVDSRESDSNATVESDEQD